MLQRTLLPHPHASNACCVNGPPLLLVLAPRLCDGNLLAVGGQIRLPIALSFRAIGFGDPIGIFIHKDRQNQWHIFVVENDLILNKATFGHTA